MRIPKKKNNLEFDISAFRLRVAKEIKAEPGDSLQSLEKFLMKWWCRHYNRPYKELSLLDYTLEELLYEFFDIQLRRDPDQLKEALGEVVESKQREAEDEEWLKDMMGSGYTSKKEQEKALSGMRGEIEEATKKEKKEEEGLEGFQHNFDLDEFE